MYSRLSEELKQARESNSLTLQQLANKTRIDIRYLQAMEEGNFSFQPELYIRAFIKSYAKFVGLDENVMVKKYQALKEGKIYHEPEPVINKKSNEHLPGDEKNRKEGNENDASPVDRTPEIKKHVISTTPSVTRFDSMHSREFPDQQSSIRQRNLIILGAIACVLILFGLIYYFFIRSNNEIIVPEKSYEEIVKENSNRYSDLEPKKDTTVGTVNYSTADSLRLLIRSDDTSWIKMTIDDTRSDEFIIFPHGKKTITAKNNYRLIIGNSRSIQFQLNEKQLDFSSPGKKVISLVIDSAGIHYTNPPDKKQG